MQSKALLMWFAAGGIAAIAVGWLAAQIHASGHAPVGLTSFGVGLLLGAALRRLAATLRVAATGRLIVGTLLLAFLAVLAQHAWLYRDFCGQWREARAKSAAVAMFRPETPPSMGEYFAREFRPGLWIADAAIIVATVVGIVIVRRRE
jgi:ABC-type uncharacterized transport system permease subunit